MITALDMLLHITSPFILSDIELYSDYQVFDNAPNRALPGLNAWILTGQDSSLDADAISDLLVMKGFELFLSPSAEVWTGEADLALEKAIKGTCPADLYIKWFVDAERNLRPYTEKPLALLKVDGSVFTIIPLEPYIMKTYEGQSGLDLGFYARIILQIARRFGIEEMKYIPNF